MDMNILKPFIDGTIETMQIQLGSQIHSGKPYLKNSIEQTPQIAIAGIVGIVSSKFRGNVSLCFCEDTFLNAMEKMLGERYPQINDEIADGAGEMMNIIYGYAKRKLNDSGHDLEKALPSVVTGENIRIAQKSQTVVIILPFNSELGPFQLEIGIEPTGEK